MDYQDMLAKIGLGSAHPGGFSATLDFLNQFPFPQGSNILEVGCGTGRTACYLAKQGYDVTALDIRPAMIEKAKVRGNLDDVTVNWLVGDATALPFDNEEFDIILIESVTVFTDYHKAVSEYFRVLKPQGKLYDREMVAIANLPPHILNEISSLYKVKEVHTKDEWIDILEDYEFEDVHVWGLTSIKEEMSMRRPEYPDPHQQLDEDAHSNPAVWDIMMRNAQVMSQYADWLGYGVLIASKA